MTNCKLKMPIAYAFHHSRMVLNEANIVICCGDYAEMWHADPQSAKQTNVMLRKQRNGQPNAIFHGGY